MSGDPHTPNSHSHRSPWRTLLAERAPLAAMLGVGVLQSLASAAVSGAGLRVVPIVVGGAGVASLLVLMRLMDEVKDLDRDRVAHPERPLPRGLVSEASVRRAIATLGATLLVVAIVIALAGNRVAGALYATCVAYTGLMYRELFAGRALQRHVFTYALTHQVIVLPMYAFTVALASPARAFAPETVWLALSGLGASFTFEVARKLDPAAHPVLGTYLLVSGRYAVVVAMAAAITLLAVSTWHLGVPLIVWPFAAIMAATLPLVYLRPRRFRVIEGAAAAQALAQVLAPTLRYAWTLLR